MKSAKVTITDIARDDDKPALYMIACDIKAEKYRFKKTFAIRPNEGKVTPALFKKRLRSVILEEVDKKKKIEKAKREATLALKPLLDMQGEEMVLEYEENESKD